MDKILRNMSSLVSHFCCTPCRKAEKNLDYLLWSVNLQDLFGTFFCGVGVPFFACLLKGCLVDDQKVSPPSVFQRGKLFSLVCRGCVLMVGFLFGQGRNNRVFRGLERDPNVVLYFRQHLTSLEILF